MRAVQGGSKRPERVGATDLTKILGMKTSTSARTLARRFGHAAQAAWSSSSGRRTAAYLLGCASLVTLLLEVSTVHSEDLQVYRSGAYSLLHNIGLYGDAFPSRLPFTYPPFAAVPLTLLLPLPWAATVWLWAFGTVLLCGWVIGRFFDPLLSRLGARRTAVQFILVAGFAVSVPMSDHLGFGQINVLLMAACLADVMGFRPRWLPMGCLIGLAAAIKLTPAIFIVYLFVTGRVRAAVAASAAGSAATLVGFLLKPADSRSYFFDVLWHLDVRVGLGNNATIGNQSLDGAFIRLLPADWAHRAWLAGALVFSIYTFTCVRRVLRDHGELAAACLIGLTGVLVSPVSWPHYLVWLIPAVGVLVGNGQQQRHVTAGVLIYLLMVGRVHRLGQLAVDSNSGWIIDSAGQILESSYVWVSLFCIFLLTRRRLGTTKDARAVS